jgi:hypothetical protein
MSFQTAKNAINWIFTHVPDYAGRVEIGFIGGEPLLEFPLINDVFDYVCKLNLKTPYVFYATTNGTLLTDELKAWFTEHKNCFYLGLSIDGRKETHDRNRCNSFDKKLYLCESKQDRKKVCGIGIGTPFFDVDGKRYPWRIAKNPARYDETTRYYMIEAIKQIRKRYLGELEKIIQVKV